MGKKFTKVEDLPLETIERLYEIGFGLFVSMLRVRFKDYWVIIRGLATTFNVKSEEIERASEMIQSAEAKPSYYEISLYWSYHDIQTRKLQLIKMANRTFYKYTSEFLYNPSKKRLFRKLDDNIHNEVVEFMKNLETMADIFTVFAKKGEE